MVYCTIQEAWNTNEIPEMKYYKEMPQPPVTAANMYGYNQLEMYGNSDQTTQVASSDMEVMPYQQQTTNTDMKYLRDLSQRGGNGSTKAVVEPSSTLNEYKRLVDELKKENQELKQKLKDAESHNSSDGLLDVIMYISGGVFLLFFMEHITSSARRF
jgi:hypothetical protein